MLNKNFSVNLTVMCTYIYIYLIIIIIIIAFSILEKPLEMSSGKTLE
jgi:hypothetical protein